jgi:hypothetical protein
VKNVQGVVVVDVSSACTLWISVGFGNDQTTVSPGRIFTAAGDHDSTAPWICTSAAAAGAAATSAAAGPSSNVNRRLT